MITITSDTGEKFKLKKNTIVEDYDYLPASMIRDDLKKIFKTLKVGESDLFAFTMTNPRSGIVSNLVRPTIRYRDGIKLGCQNFTGMNFKQLRKWALSA